MPCKFSKKCYKEWHTYLLSDFSIQFHWQFLITISRNTIKKEMKMIKTQSIEKKSVEKHKAEFFNCELAPLTPWCNPNFRVTEKIRNCQKLIRNFQWNTLWFSERNNAAFVDFVWKNYMIISSICASRSFRSLKIS